MIVLSSLPILDDVSQRNLVVKVPEHDSKNRTVNLFSFFLDVYCYESP